MIESMKGFKPVKAKLGRSPSFKKIGQVQQFVDENSSLPKKNREGLDREKLFSLDTIIVSLQLNQNLGGVMALAPAFSDSELKFIGGVASLNSLKYHFRRFPQSHIYEMRFWGGKEIYPILKVIEAIDQELLLEEEVRKSHLHNIKVFSEITKDILEEIMLEEIEPRGAIVIDKNDGCLLIKTLVKAGNQLSDYTINFDSCSSLDGCRALRFEKID